MSSSFLCQAKTAHMKALCRVVNGLEDSSRTTTARPHDFLTSRVASWGQPLPYCPKGTSPVREVATADTRGLRPLAMPRTLLVVAGMPAHPM